MLSRRCSTSAAPPSWRRPAKESESGVGDLGVHPAGRLGERPRPGSMNRRYEVDAVRGDERVGLVLDAATVEDGFELVTSGPLGRHRGQGRDLFDALLDLRRALEADGWRLAVQGARRDTWPSGMLRDQLDGAAVYVLPEDVKEKPETVGTFDPAPPDLVVTVAEQEAAWDAWRQRPRG